MILLHYSYLLIAKDKGKCSDYFMDLIDQLQISFCEYIYLLQHILRKFSKFIFVTIIQDSHGKETEDLIYFICTQVPI